MARYPQAVLISCEAPWDERENLLEDVFRRQVRHGLDLGFNHIYIFGTAGEGYACDTPRFQQLVQVFREETNKPDVHPMVGIIGLSTPAIVERMGYAYDQGFRVFQISLPSWGALNDTELLTFFKDVCGTFPDAKFLHYNLPRTKRVLTGKDYRRIIDVVPNLVATKNTGGGHERAYDLMKHSPELQHFFSESNYVHGCFYGECSILSSFGPMIPKKTFELFEAGKAMDVEKMFRLQHEIYDMMMDVLGPVLAEGRIDGAYDKMIVRLAGLQDMTIHLLSPYQGFTEEQYLACEQVFKAKYAGW